MKGNFIMLLRGRSNEIPRSNEGDGQQSPQTRSRRRSPSITSTEDAPPPTNAAQQIARGVMPTFGAGASYSQDMSPTTDAARENVPSGSQSHGNDTTLHPEEQSSRGPTNEVDSSITESPNPSWYETWWEKLQ